MRFLIHFLVCRANNLHTSLYYKLTLFLSGLGSNATRLHSICVYAYAIGVHFITLSIYVQ